MGVTALFQDIAMHVSLFQTDVVDGCLKLMAEDLKDFDLWSA